MSASGNMEAALAYAERGLQVFPVHFLRKGQCSCGGAECKSPGKHPIPKNGCLDATVDEGVVRKWWKVNPEAHIGIATGPESGCFVVDLDGQQGIEDFGELHDEALDVPMVSTGGGGRHLWFAYPDSRAINNGTKLHGTCIDIRGAGGYVVCPPSGHQSGTSYAWETPLNGSLPEAPEWLLDWISSVKGTPGKLVMAGDLDGPGVAEGKRHETLVEYVGRHLGHREAGTVVLQKALRWASTCTPPMDEEEVLKVVTDIEQRHRANNPDGETSEKPEKRRQRTQAALLLDLAVGTEVFHDTEGRAFVAFQIDQHVESWPVRSRVFRQWLARSYWLEHKSTANSQAIDDALNVLEGSTLFDGDEERVHIRTAFTGDVSDADDADIPTQSIAVDLGTPDWKCVVVTAEGWSIVDRSPVWFRRSPGLRPLPIPQRGGSVDLLQGYLNIQPESWPLLAAWLLAALRPTGPYPVLALYGEAGTGKSTASRILRALADPNEAPLRRQPKNEEDLVIAAHNSWVLTLDNLSRIPVWLSDAICRLSTGGGFSTRTLFKNEEETLFSQTRPVIVNGIEELAVRGDLVDRCLQVTLERIDEADMIPEAEFWAEFERQAPLIFGGLLSALSMALRKLPETHLDALPRMADFALLATAGEEALGLQTGGFIEAYRQAASTANETVLDASNVGRAVRKLMTTTSSWEGTASELLSTLEQKIDDEERKSREWPKDGRGVSNRLRRIAPNLRAEGIGVEFVREMKRRIIRLISSDWVDDSASSSSSASCDADSSENEAPVHDADDANDAHDANHPTQFKTVFRF